MASESKSSGASSGAGASLAPQLATSEAAAEDLLLHPLVIINISDHFTRTREQGEVVPDIDEDDYEGGGEADKALVGIPGGIDASPLGRGGNPDVYGLLYGSQVGRRVEVFYSFEMAYVRDSKGNLHVDEKFIKHNVGVVQTVYPKYELLGWYTTGNAVVEDHMRLHRILMKFNEDPVMVRVDPAAVAAGQKDLPVSCYQSVVVTTDGAQSNAFAEIPFRIDAVATERITVDAVSQSSDDAKGKSTVVGHAGKTIGALQRLRERVQTILTLLKATKAGKLRPTRALLRQVAACSSRLPAGGSDEVTSALAGELGDGGLLELVSHLSRGVRGAQSVVSMSEEAAAMESRMGGGAGGRGRGGGGGGMGMGYPGAGDFEMGGMGMGGGMMGMMGGMGGLRGAFNRGSRGSRR